jgi:hypothetical protein
MLLPCLPARRELRQSLVDMEEFFEVLQTSSGLKDGSQALRSSPSAASRNGNGNGNGNGSMAHHIDERNGAPGSGAEASTSGAAAGAGQGLQVELRDVRFGYQSGREVRGALLLLLRLLRLLLSLCTAVPHLAHGTWHMALQAQAVLVPLHPWRLVTPTLASAMGLPQAPLHCTTCY